jgi:hypothetical protein
LVWDVCLNQSVSRHLESDRLIALTSTKAMEDPDL